MAAVRVGRRTKPRRLAGEKVYSRAFVRRYLWGRGVRPVVPG
ncbi:MAG TPA: hypothetical protein VF796_15210 [Humisphaera sp.]